MGNFTMHSHSGFLHWNSPTPFLFAGLAIILGVMAVALFVLACLQLRVDSSQDSRKDEALEVNIAGAEDPIERHIVVIMPGDDKPRYLAKPCAATILCSCIK
uniref:Uncharacterized protein n=1 Tax=Kalanchoe fedtschenkoi TaxID=63787 RepID=A0A7N0UFW9_KALFE